MSADNGIYVLETEGADGSEFRVAHLQAVENVYYDTAIECESDDYNVWIRNARRMWRDCDVYTNEDDAWAVARELLKEYEKDGIVEYGVSRIYVPGFF